MVIQNSHYGEINGIYKIIGVGENSLYKVKCMKCGKIFYKRYTAITGKYETNSCKHNPIVSIKTIKNKRLHKIFYAMTKRCYNENNQAYRWYGAKGVQICDEWMNDPSKFESWALANGYKDDLTIDRIDSNGDYCPENCRWITMEENSRRANSNMITVDGETLSGTQWAEKLNLCHGNICKILKNHGYEFTVDYIRKRLKNKDFKLKYKVLITVDGTTLNCQQWADKVGMAEKSLLYTYHTYGNDYTADYIKKKIKNKDFKNYRSVKITVDDCTMSCAGWSKLLGMCHSGIHSIYKKHGYEFTVDYIRKRLTNKLGPI